MEKFKDLHNSTDGLILGNAWDTMSALIMEQQGFKALGTTSWGVANSLGFNDGEKISFSEYLIIVKKILSVVSIPVSVDIESGFGKNNTEIIENILKLASIGCSGINIEDSNTDGSLKNKKEFSNLLILIKKELKNKNFNNFFINTRIDTYLTLDKPSKETIDRANLYEKSGTDGIFVPGLENENEIKELLRNINVPLNILSLPGCTDYKKLKEIGVKRFSFGNALSDLVISKIENVCNEMLSSLNTKCLYDHPNLKTDFKD